MPRNHIISNCEIQYPTLGDVKLCVRTNTRSITARWKNGKVQLNVPYGIGMNDVVKALDKFVPTLLKNKPVIRYHDGQSFVFEGLTINIRRQSLHPQKILGQVRIPSSTICVGSDLDFDNDDTTKHISNMMCRIAKRAASYILLPRARQLSKKTGISPLGWSISTGHRILGRCNTDGFIALSYMLVFLPQHLRDYVIFHEIAHLSEMNHSPQFHQLCDKYCGGNETKYLKELKAYKWPVLR